VKQRSAAPGDSASSEDPPRVLIVDDAIVVRHILAITVRQLPGYAQAIVDEAGNGAIAVKKLEEHRYRFVLSDVRMPLMDGLELARHLRQVIGDRETPLLLISTLGTAEDIERGLAAGATEYVIKPLSPHHILEALLAIPQIVGTSGSRT
jgi:CheY-like chemotaxis protein